jgi:hypothetical protein
VVFYFMVAVAVTGIAIRLVIGMSFRFISPGRAFGGGGRGGLRA